MNTNIITQEQTMDLSALDAMFPGAEDVMTPAFKEEAVVPNILENRSNDKALDVDITKKDTKVEDKITEVQEPVSSTEVYNTLDGASNELVESNDDTTQHPADTKKGRPSNDKSTLVSYLTKKVESNEFGIPQDEPFDAKKQSLSDYLSTLSEEKLHNILDSNVRNAIDEVRASTPQEFFQSLPEELQYAAAYVAEGGQDLRGLFKALSHVEEVRALDPEKESDQIQITRNYLQATGWKDDAIAEQVEEWKEAGRIEKKAKEFKPALDAMQKQQVDAQLQHAAEQRREQQQLAQFYADNVYEQLNKGELGGIKIDKKFASQLGNDLVSTVPGPWSGKPVNALGYGLEKVQYIEPDYEAVIMATWLLNDKKGFLEAMGTAKANKAVENTAKLIKMNQGLGISEQPVVPDKPVRRIPNNNNVLKRKLV
jgi:hypothetical protein